MFMRKIRNLVKQYGFWGAGKRIMKYFFRTIGFNYESYFFLQKDLSEILYLDCENEPYKVLTLSYNDFVSSIRSNNYLEIDEAKRCIIEERFKQEGYTSYGIYDKNDLVYACWLSLNVLEIPGNGIISSNDKQCFFLDDFCAPHKRGLGIHKVANAKRLMDAKRKGKEKALIVILKGNRPALKTQMDKGFQKCFSFYTFKFLNWKKSNFFTKYQIWVNL